MKNEDSDILGFLTVVEDIDGISVSPEAQNQLKKTAVELVSDDLRDRLLSWLDSLDTGKEEFVLPEKAPELYVERKNKTEDATTFFYRVYDPWLRKGIIIYQDNLRGKNGLDKKLIKGIVNQCENNREKIASIVPPKSKRIKKELKELKEVCDLKKMGQLVRASYRHS